MANPVTRIIITAKDEASAVFSGLRAHAGKIATAIAGYFGAKMFGDVVGAARDFETAMSAVQAAAGASGDELATLRAAAEQAGATTKYSSVEAANALENLAKSGLSASQAVEALPAVLNLASAGGVELGTAAEFITKAVNGMGLEFSEAGRVADVLAMGANASNTSVTGLAQALSYAAPLANSLGLSLEQTVAIIGKFADAGIDASRAGTALNSILAQFSDPASKFRRELAAAGITTNDFDQALRQLAAAGPAGQKAINAVGQEAGPALRALLNQGIGALDTLKGKLDESAGSAATFAKVMSNNLDGAAKGFSSAWDALLIKLGTPVLETLAKQIAAVSDRLRAFVADGTATAFGNAIRSAFEAGGKWAADFVSKIDFTQVAASLQSFAATTGEVFTAIGQYASTAGNTLQTAYGVMSGGINAVLAAVYKLGQGMSWLTSAFLADLASITQGLAKITFGDLSAGFAQASAAMKLEAQAAYAVFEEFGRKSDAAFAAAVTGAETARAGWAALTKATTEGAAATAAALQQVEQQSGLTADQLDALGTNAEVAAGKVVSAGQGAATAAQGVTQLGAAANATAADVGKIGQSAEDAAAAFGRLGITTDAELKRAAANARRDFEIIKNSGTASAREIQQAFSIYAERAIAANNGVASATLKAEAGQHKVAIAADEAGRSVVQSMNAAKGATASLGDTAEQTAAKFALIGAAAEDAADAAGSAAPKDKGGAGGGSGGGGRTSATRRFAETDVALARAESLGGLELRKEIEEGWRRAFRNQPVDMTSERYKRVMSDTAKRLDELQIAQERASGRYATNAPQVAGTAPTQSTQVYRVEIGTGAGQKRTINTATQADAAALVDLIRQLENDMSRA